MNPSIRVISSDRTEGRDVSQTYGWSADERTGQAEQRPSDLRDAVWFHAHMESWGVAITNPYFAKTDEQGRFTMTDVPRARISWLCGIPISGRRRKTSPSVRGTVETTIGVPAPTGRLYANEVLDHAYTRYNVTEEAKEIDPLLQKQEH